MIWNSDFYNKTKLTKCEIRSLSSISDYLKYLLDHAILRQVDYIQLKQSLGCINETLNDNKRRRLTEKWIDGKL